MNVLIKTTLVTVALLASAQTIAAEGRPHRPHDPGVNHRQHQQEQRIKQGVRSGELTRAETRELARERREIRQEEHAYKADGKLTPEERKDLHQDLNALNKEIYEQKHDDERR